MDYEYNGIPESGIPKLPEVSFEQALAAVKGILDANDFDSIEVTAGFVYDRKGYFSIDPLAGPRNRSYGSERDDVVLQLTMRVQRSKVTELVLAAQESQTKEIAAAIAAELVESELERTELESKIARLRQKQAELA